MDLPKQLSRGTPARLFPVIAETGKEQRAASILLAVMSAVPEFAKAILNAMAPRIGVRAEINTFTEVVFQTERGKQDKKDRPDGLIEIKQASSIWRALIEAKIGTAKLDLPQIERYMELARDNNVDALITISNEFVARPDHHPLSVRKVLLNRVGLYHISWQSILTEAMLMHEQGLVSDPEQAFLIRELVRFLAHSSAGVAGVTSMPKAWSSVISSIQSGSTLKRTDDIVEDVVGAWHQETKDFALMLSQEIGVMVQIQMPRAHAKNQVQRFSDDCDYLVTDEILYTTLRIPDTAGDIYIEANLKTRSIKASIEILAPEDKKSAKARVNWLTRQLKEVNPDGICVSVSWKSRQTFKVYSLADLLEYPEIVQEEQPKGAEIKWFTVSIASNNVKHFSGPQTFIRLVEEIVPDFYTRVVQNLQAWIPKPPQAKDKAEALPEEKGNNETKVLSGGNAKDQLLDIPDYLKRVK